MTIEEIKLLKEKHKSPNCSDLKNKLNESLALVKNDGEKQTQKLAENEMEIQTITSKLSSLMEELSRESSILESKSKDLKKYKEELESLESEVKKVTGEQHQLQLKKENLKQIKPNLKDQRLIDQGLRKFNLLKEITGIRWNFEAMETATKGYVTNKQDYIHSFNYDLETSDQELSNSLWKEIEKPTIKSSLSKESSKENKSSN